MKNNAASKSAKLSLIKVVVLHPTTMEEDQCYMISTKRPKGTMKEDNHKIQAHYCNTVRNIYVSRHSWDNLKTLHILFVTPS